VTGVTDPAGPYEAGATALTRVSVGQTPETVVGTITTPLSLSTAQVDAEMYFSQNLGNGTQRAVVRLHRGDATGPVLATQVGRRGDPQRGRRERPLVSDSA